MSSKARKREIRKLKQAGLPVIPKERRRRRVAAPIFDPLSAALMMAALGAGKERRDEKRRVDNC